LDQLAVRSEDESAVVWRAANGRGRTIRGTEAHPAIRVRGPLVNRDQAKAIDAGAADVLEEGAVRDIVAAIGQAPGIDVDHQEAVLAAQPRNVGREDAVLVGIFAMDRDVAA